MRRSGRLIRKLFHADTVGGSDGYIRRIKPLKAVYIDAIKVRCYALAMERVYATDTAKIMSRGFGMKLIRRQRLLSFYDSQ